VLSAAKHFAFTDNINRIIGCISVLTLLPLKKVPEKFSICFKIFSKWEIIQSSTKGNTLGASLRLLCPIRLRAVMTEVQLTCPDGLRELRRLSKGKFAVVDTMPLLLAVHLVRALRNTRYTARRKARNALVTITQ
jgi:hypothetical protein